MLVIGERINASNKSVGQAIANKDEEFLANLAKAQADAGADFIDVNAGVGRECHGKRHSYNGVADRGGARSYRQAPCY